MRCVYLTGIAMALAACDAEMLSQGQIIRPISAQAAAECQFLGPVPDSELFGRITAPDTTSALSQVQSGVLKLGGNAFVLTYWDSNSDGATAKADVYSCS